MADDDGADQPTFQSAPPERIDLPIGLELVRCDTRWTSAAVTAINESLDHLRPWMAWAAEPATEAGMATFFAASAQLWDARKDFGYSIVDPANGAVVGGCGLHGRIGPTGLEIGYWVHVDWTGKGVATEASRVLTSAAFTIEGIERMRIQCEEGNVVSARVPEKLGYTFEGVVVPGEGTCAGRPTQRWTLERSAWNGALSSSS